MLLIVSNKTDLATDYLILKLREKGIKFFRLNTEDYLSVWDVSFFLDSSGYSAFIFTNSIKINLTHISGAYIRQPRLPTLSIHDADADFARREIGESLRALWRYIDDDIWLNAPHNILRASNKPEQLKIAQRLGFHIPQTFIGADMLALRDFCHSVTGDVIVKAVKHGFLYDGHQAKVAATQKINKDNLEDLINYAKLPMIVQERIHKKCDIRVTVIGEKLYATAIYSQEYEETAVDWRLADHYKISLKHESIELPSAICDLCIVITKYFKLKYSAIDLILSKDGQYYFLEMNPNGQWAWIEQLTDYPIRDAIIEALLGGGGKQL